MSKINILLVFLFICGCSAQQNSADILYLRLREDPTTLDPAFIVDVAGGIVASKIYSGLVRFNENCVLVPDIAESWEISGDGRIYTFRLRSDSGITSEKIKKSFERIISPQTLSPRSWIFNKVDSFETPDHLTLRIKLKEPYSPFLSLLTMPNAYIEGSGPYKLKSWEHDQKIVLEANTSYFGDKPKVKGIVYRIIPEEFTAKTEFELGKLDITEISPVDLLVIKEKTVSSTGLNVYYMGFNCQSSMFGTDQIRQAFNYAVDKNAIARNVLQGQAQITGGPVPGVLLKNDIKPYPYLPNRAKKMLAGIKFEHPVKIYIRAESQAVQIAEAVQHYLLQIGIEMEIKPLEWSAFKEAVAKGESDIFLMSWWADYPDPENFIFPTFYSGNWGMGGNRSRFQNKTIDKLILQAQKNADPHLYEKLQRIISRQAPWIFLWNKKDLYAVKPWIEGLKIYPVYNSDKGTDIAKNTKLQDTISK